MTEQSATGFYVSELARLARQLPTHEAVKLLYGALLVGGEHDALDPIWSAYRRLHDADAQLDLIAAPQLRLPLDGHNPA